MTDPTLTGTALIEALALHAGVTSAQARTILESAGVKVEPEMPAPGWYLTEDGEVARVKPNKHTGALILHMDGDVLLPHQTWPQLTPARVVPAAAAPVTLTEDQVGEVRDKGATGADTSLWLEYPVAHREEFTRLANDILAQYAAPAEGQPIDPDDVRDGDLVRLEMDNGDEITITVTRVGRAWFESDHNSYPRHNIRTIHLLDREGEA